MFRPLAAAAVLLAAPAAWGQGVVQADGGESANTAPARPAPLRIGGGVPVPAGDEPAADRLASPWSAAGPLAAVLVLFAVAAVAWKKTAGRRGPGVAGPCEVLAKVRLEPRATVFVVRVGGRALVVGGGADGLRTLSEIADPAEAAALFDACRKPPAADAAGNAGRESFRVLFNQGATEPEPAAAENRPPVSAAERRLAERLRPAPAEAAA